MPWAVVDSANPPQSKPKLGFGLSLSDGDTANSYLLLTIFLTNLQHFFKFYLLKLLTKMPSQTNSRKSIIMLLCDGLFTKYS